MKLEDLLGKTCLIGLTYYGVNNELLKQVQHSGRVISVDAEEGITLQLDRALPKNTIQTDSTNNNEQFVLPPLLTPWFIAPPGHYKNAECQIDIKNPDYFVTWDISKTTESTPEGEHEWWGWEPCIAPPRVN